MAIDGTLRGVTPLKVPDLAPGAHRVTISSGRTSVDRTVEVTGRRHRNGRGLRAGGRGERLGRRSTRRSTSRYSRATSTSARDARCELRCRLAGTRSRSSIVRPRSGRKPPSTCPGGRSVALNVAVPNGTSLDQRPAVGGSLGRRPGDRPDADWQPVCVARYARSRLAAPGSWRAPPDGARDRHRTGPARRRLDTMTAGAFLATSLLALAQIAGSTRAESEFNNVKQLYATAAYAEALTRLSALDGRHDPNQLDQYRALCLDRPRTRPRRRTGARAHRAPCRRRFKSPSRRCPRPSSPGSRRSESERCRSPRTARTRRPGPATT